MKSIGIFYATREGHTERIAEHVASRLRERGFEAGAKNLRTPARDIDLTHYAAVVLAASVHAGEHESEMRKFVRQHLDDLNRIPAAFLSVTLSEAGAEMPDRTPEEHARFAADVQKMIDVFFKQTGWHPSRVKPIAGALLYTRYNVLIRFIMKRIAKKAGAATDTSHDYDYTDWAALDRFVDEFASEVDNPPTQE